VCSFTGIHFLKVKTDSAVDLRQELPSYEMDHFVNRAIEYCPDKILAVTWDNNKVIFIDHEKGQITNIVEHPQSDEKLIRCWGL
jgi:hypothetical protein